jgi:protein involved in sex pheromone biosynthesis
LKKILVLTALAIAMFLSACTAEQIYGFGLAWQRNQCSENPDMAASERCMQDTNISYDSYKRQLESAKK